jgi:hypothetical protein
MAFTEKGKKGFQKAPDGQKKDCRVVFYLNPKEIERLKTYCQKGNIKPSTLIRDRLSDVISD